MPGPNWLGRQVSIVPTALKAQVLMEYLLRRFPVAVWSGTLLLWHKTLIQSSATSYMKPFSPTQCSTQFTSHSTVSPLTRPQAKAMCPNWTSWWILQYQLQDFPLSDLPLCKDSEVTPGHPPPSFTLFRRITSNMGNAKSQFPSVREEFPDGTALFT